MCSAVFTLDEAIMCSAGFTLNEVLMCIAGFGPGETRKTHLRHRTVNVKYMKACVRHRTSSCL